MLSEVSLARRHAFCKLASHEHQCMNEEVNSAEIHATVRKVHCPSCREPLHIVHSGNHRRIEVMKSSLHELS